MTSVIQREEKIDKQILATVLGNYCKVDIYANERKVTIEVPEGESMENSETITKDVYEYDFTRFSFDTNEFNHTLEEIEENPEMFINFEDNVSYQREQALATIQKWNDEKTNEKCILPSSLGFTVEYSPKALSLVQGVMLLMNNGMMTETTWTDGNDVKHEHIGLDEIKTIGAIFAGYVMQIQETADNAREQVRKSLSSKEIKEISAIFRKN